eukprot:258183_1
MTPTQLLTIIFTIQLGQAELDNYKQSPVASNKSIKCSDIITEVQRGLRISTDTFYFEKNVVSDSFTQFYGRSVSIDSTVWTCIDLFLIPFLKNKLDIDISDSIRFDETKAAEQVNSLLNPMNEIITEYQYDTNNDLYLVNLCNIISDVMNTVNITDWRLNSDNTTLFSPYTDLTDKKNAQYLSDRMDLFKDEPQYFYTTLPHLAQYINLRFDFITLFYNNTRDISYCQDVMFDYNAAYELNKFYQITSDLLLLYFNTYIEVLADLRSTESSMQSSALNYTSLRQYLGVVHQKGVFCDWFDISFKILNNTNVVITNNVHTAFYSHFGDNDFSPFATDCASTFMQYQMYTNDYYCNPYEDAKSRLRPLWLMFVVLLHMCFVSVYNSE